MKMLPISMSVKIAAMHMRVYTEIEKEVLFPHALMAELTQNSSSPSDVLSGWKIRSTAKYCRFKWGLKLPIGP